MIPERSLVLLLLVLTIAATALAGPERFRKALGEDRVLHGAPVTAKALGDTLYLLGNPRNPDQVSEGGVPPRNNGTFEDEFGVPGWFGWTHEDLTDSAEVYWNVSDHLPVAGAYSLWCGTVFHEGETNEDRGYGNSWNQSVVFTHQVADNAASATVNLVCTLQYDTEPNYDFAYIEFNLGGVWIVWNGEGYDGLRTEYVDATQIYQPADYVGSESDEIQIRVRFASDSALSDEDAILDTDGACRIDDVTVSIDGAIVDDEDFEDQVSDRWIPFLEPGVGDYAAFYQVLQDVDPCHSNDSWQVAFVDDGVVVPYTDGTWCTTWCYGPGGFIVNNTGGPRGPDHYIDNMIISPVLEWRDGLDAARFAFDAYRHEELGSFGTWPGIFYAWYVRSVATGDPDDLDDVPYVNREYLHFGPPGYIRHDEIITDLLQPGRTHVQVCLRVMELGYAWGWVGTDGTPAPYFDNVSVRAYPYAGPAMAARSIDIFNDGFPDIGELDLTDLARNAVRLDAAQSVAPVVELRNCPGDSIWFDIAAVRAGSALNDLPKMHVRMVTNPVFDDVRVLPPNFVHDGHVVTGWVYGDSTYTAHGTLVPDRYNFDLPDDDFFFPGDVLRYYVEAQDNLAGDIGTSLIPADTAGFAPRNDTIYSALRFAADFEVRALPTVFTANPGDQPRILFWDDATDRGGTNEWLYALGHAGLTKGNQFDLYATNGPSSGVGNGLGGRATSAVLGGYQTLIYTSASLSTDLLSNGDFYNDPSRDLQVVDGWLAQGGKSAFMTGDNLVTGLLDAGPLGEAFVHDYFNVSYVAKSVKEFIGEQTAPRVVTVPGNDVIVRVPEWIAYGGCPVINTFDAVVANAGTVRLAEFTDVAGNPGVFPYAAGSYYYNSGVGAEVVLLPYDLMYLHNVAGWQPPAGYSGIPARSIILEDILEGFGHLSGDPVGVTPDAPLAARSFPNPFNPAATIQLTVPRAGDVTLKVFNVRGELVRILVADRLEAGVHDIVWDGRGGDGSPVASGVYFYETRAGGETLVDKMTLVK